jgi:hypothetical protein
MTSNSTSPKLRKIDQSNISDHPFLSLDDQCYYMWEYTARAGYSFGRTNDLITNFKRSAEYKGKPPYDYYKPRAIRDLEMDLRSALAPEQCAGITFVPIPPSKARTDLLYDDRMLRLFAEFGRRRNIDVRELVRQTKSVESSRSLGGSRHSPDDLVALYEIDESVAAPVPGKILICDDVLTSGAHFRAMHAVLSERFPDARIGGLFLARTVQLNPFADDTDV